MKPSERGVLLLACALLFGGLRDPHLFALGGALVWILVRFERPALGPAAYWIPWFAWSGLAAGLSLQPWAALPNLARWASALAFFSLAAQWGPRERERWLAALGATAAVLAAAALATGARAGFGPTMVGILPPYYNYTAFVLAATAAAGAALALHERAPSKARVAGAAAAALGASCVLLAHSRGATLGLLAAGIVWAGRRWGLRAVFVVAAMAAFSGVLLQSGHLPSGLKSTIFKEGRRHREVRPLIWRSASTIASERPLFGAGPGSFASAFSLHPVESLGSTARWGMGSDYAHSELLQAASETGWVGLGLWLLGFSACLMGLAGRAGADPVREAAVAAVAAMSVQLTVDNMLQVPGLAMLFFSAVAVSRPWKAGSVRWPVYAPLAGCVLALTAWMPRALARKNPARAVTLFPAEAGLREDLAYAQMAQGRLIEADRTWSHAQQRAPFNAIYPWQRARLAAARRDWVAAEALAGQAFLLEPNFLDARVQRAEALLRLGRRAEARAELERVIAELAARVERTQTAHYDEAIWSFDRTQFERVSALVRGR